MEEERAGSSKDQTQMTALDINDGQAVEPTVVVENVQSKRVLCS